MIVFGLSVEYIFQNCILLMFLFDLFVLYGNIHTTVVVEDRYVAENIIAITNDFAQLILLSQMSEDDNYLIFFFTTSFELTSQCIYTLPINC